LSKPIPVRHDSFVKATFRIGLWTLLLGATILLIREARQVSQEARKSETIGPWFLLALRDEVEKIAYLSEDLGHSHDSPWMPESVPQSWVEKATNRRPGIFISIEEVKAASKEKPFEVIKLTQLAKSREGHPRFLLVRWRYFWRGDQWMKRSMSEYYVFAIVLVNEQVLAVYTPPLAISCPAR
jgi:hypothetical protein